MLIVAPFTDMSPETTAALDATGLAWEAWELTEDDDYWTLLAYLWARQETTVICEHDVQPGPGQITSLLACSKHWCGYTTPYVNGQNFGMGLVRFTRQLMRALPSAINDIGRYSDATHEPRHWCRLDLWLQRTVLWPSVGQPCIHGSTSHTNETPRHGCHLLANDPLHA